MNHKVAFSFADGKTLFFPVQANEILLDAALRNGINIPLDCREGVCGTCQGRCDSGDYSQDYVDEEALCAQDLLQRKMLSCQTGSNPTQRSISTLLQACATHRVLSLSAAQSLKSDRCRPVPRSCIWTLARQANWISCRGNTPGC